eukprot:jgi/Ulvmu1/9630/UM054_0061.1
MICVVCSEPAVIWCHNDEAALCEACDAMVHATGPLAWKHTRTRMSPDGTLQDATSESEKHQLPSAPTQAQSPMPSPAEALQIIAERAAGPQKRAAHDSMLSVDLSAMFNEIDPRACESFDINQIAEAFKAESLDLLNLPMMPSFDVINEHLPDVEHKAAQLHPTGETSPAAARTGAAAAASKCAKPPSEMPPPPDKPKPEQPQQVQQAQHSMCSISSSTSSASTQSGQLLRKDTPQSQIPPQAMPAPTRLLPTPSQQPPPPQPSAAALTLSQPPPAQPVPAEAPPPVPAQAVQPEPAGDVAVPHTQHVQQQQQLVPMPMVPAAVPPGYMMPPLLTAPFHSLFAYMSYIPASLMPRAPSVREAARQALRVRRERFKEKKSRMQTSGRVVRYISRKVYADTRPRINGRFIRKESDDMQPLAC